MLAISRNLSLPSAEEAFVTQSSPALTRTFFFITAAQPYYKGRNAQWTFKGQIWLFRTNALMTAKRSLKILKILFLIYNLVYFILIFSETGNNWCKQKRTEQPEMTISLAVSITSGHFNGFCSLTDYCFLYILWALTSYKPRWVRNYLNGIKCKVCLSPSNERDFIFHPTKWKVQ